MAKRRSYEQKLLDDLRNIPVNKWFKIDNRPDYDKFVTQVKIFIDVGEPFIFSSDYKKIKHESNQFQIPTWHKEKKLPDGFSVKVIESGPEVIEFKGRSLDVKGPKRYEIYFNDKLIAVET